MSNNNTVISAGVTLVNKAKQAQVENTAQYLIGCITSEQAAIKLAQQSIKLEQENLSKLGLSLLTAEDVFGTVPTNPNMNQKTILESLEKMNKNKQAQVELQSQTYIQRVDQHKAGIKAREKNIADYRKQLSDLSADVVTEAQIMG